MNLLSAGARSHAKLRSILQCLPLALRTLRLQVCKQHSLSALNYVDRITLGFLEQQGKDVLRCSQVGAAEAVGEGVQMLLKPGCSIWEFP